MLNYGRNKDMEKRPKQEPKFSMQNKNDKMIVIFVICSLLIVGALIALFICAYVFKWF